VKAVIAESYEMIHSSNLVGMGIIPFQYLDGQNATSLGLSGKETITVNLPQNLQPGQTVEVKVSVWKKKLCSYIFCSSRNIIL
jgi:aconitate hydratase